MLNVNAFELHVRARLLDFFDSKSPWQRGLWTPSVVLMLKEVLQASEAVAAEVLTGAALHNVAGYAVELVGRDPACGDAAQKKVLQHALRTESKNGGIHSNGVDYRTVKELTSQISSDYLQEWSVCLRPGHAGIAPERAARAIASHLLDSGFGSDYLHKWWTYKTAYAPGIESLSDLLAQAHEMLSHPHKTYEVLLAFEHAPVPNKKSSSTFWLTNTEVSRWLRGHGFETSGLRQRGGIKLQISARDTFSAAENTVEIIDRLITRVSFGTYQRIVPINRLWIAGERTHFVLRSARRRVEVHALSRQNQVYSTEYSSQIDAGIELAAPLNSELTSAAIAGGWAAIESLMTGPGDKERVLAADRMAMITACSLPRAELTALSYKLEEQGGATAAQLHACKSNRDRALILADLITLGNTPAFLTDSDTAALNRTSALLSEPHRVLRDIEHHIAMAFRRLYRHRNMVLHWGKTNSIGIRSCLRAVAPLVGAGLDRIAHAALSEKIDPLELAARAAIRLGTVGGASGRSPLDLLETP